MTALRLPAPAKINLFLNILGRRPDGYHDLQTVFQILDYGDWLVFEPAHEIVVEPAIAGIDPQENLVYRAARRLAAAANVSLGARIRLEKHIPMGAGLGGGSSDAATTLVGLSRLWGLDMALDELAELGLGLGADVPVFVRGFSAFAEGIGERLTPLALPRRWYLVIYPGCAVSTARVFGAPDLTRNGSPITIARFLEQGAGNACEAVVRRLYPEVDEAIRWLAPWGTAKMTGTGSSVFLGFDSKAQAMEVASAVPERWSAFVAAGVQRSPLHRVLEDS